LYNSGKSRKYLARVLWLMGLDDDEKTISKAYDSFKGEQPLWYWITFVPQLLNALSGKECAFARQILVKIAANFPQALHFHLRTTKEEMAPAKKADQAQQQKQESKKEEEAKKEDKMETDQEEKGGKTEEPEKNTSGTANETKRQPWQYVDELMTMLKTAFPLLALSMETMIDQMINKLKPTMDEDIYRLIVALLNDGVQVKVFLVTFCSNLLVNQLIPEHYLQLPK
jgi:transformation/transcription domain-associated protein